MKYFPATVADCDFYTTLTDGGQFVGRCQQFPDLRTRPRDNSLDAVDAIVTATAARIGRLIDQHPPTATRRHP